MAKIELDCKTAEVLAAAVAQHLKEELEVEIGVFEAGDLVRILAERIGPVFYNQGLKDAQALLRARLETITDAIEGLEKPER
jgi:uncharacterized protein (DUF2164 family)